VTARVINKFLFLNFVLQIAIQAINRMACVVENYFLNLSNQVADAYIIFLNLTLVLINMAEFFDFRL
jgi:hypothetical protein